MVNLERKKVTPENAYEVWQSFDGDFTTYVLSKKQSDEISDKNPYAIWYVMTRNNRTKQDDYGDTYVHSVKADACKLNYNPFTEK